MLKQLRDKFPTNAWLVWGLAAFFFFSEYFARVSPSVMVPDLVRAFGVNARELGSLAAYFYLAYVIMQIPVGLLVDRYGAHLWLVLTAFLCAFGCFLFGSTSSLFVAEFARFILGFSAAFAFVGALKLAAVWFSHTQFGLFAGLTQAAGMLGAAVGEAPMAVVVEKYGWRSTMEGMAVVFLVLATLMILFIRDYPNTVNKAAHKEEHVSGLWVALIEVLKNPQTWYNGLFVGFLFAPTAAFAEFWGVSFLERAQGLSAEHAAFAISLIFVGWFIGSPIAGWLSDKQQKRKPIMFYSTICGLVLMSLVIYVPHLSVTWIFICLFLYGLTNTGVAISYALAGEINRKKVAGTSLAFANMTSVAIGAALQPLIGAILDSLVTGSLPSHGLEVFTAHDFKIAMVAIPIMSLLGLLTLLKVKETFCKTVD